MEDVWDQIMLKKYKFGDVFSVQCSERECAAIQYVGQDKTQLNSDVVIVFKRKFSSSLDLEPVSFRFEEILFYTHTSIATGVKLGCWALVKNCAPPDIELRFKWTSDLASEVEVSSNWYEWTPNGKILDIGYLSDATRGLELGVVFSPLAVVERIRTGKLICKTPG